MNLYYYSTWLYIYLRNFKDKGGGLQMTRIFVTLQSESKSNLLMTIKKHTGLGLSEIKKRISNDQPLIDAKFANRYEMQKIKDIIENLNKHNANFKLFEQGEDYKEELPLEHFMNGFEAS